MRFEVLLKANFQTESDPRGWPRLLSEMAAYEQTYPDEVCGHHGEWLVEPNQWHILPMLRKLIIASEPCSWSESWRFEGHDDPQDATLVRLETIGQVGVQVEGAAMEVEPCPGCGQPRHRPMEEGRPRIELPPLLWTTNLFHVADSPDITLMAEPLWERLRQQGLARGLRAYPVDVGPEAEETYYGIYSEHTLDAAAPYGWKPEGRCDACGRGAPNFAFYKTFHHPAPGSDGDVDWFYMPEDGPAHPVVTQRVYRWLRNEGRDWVGDAITGRPAKGRRHGWFPDDRARAFLPERFQGQADAPMEPLQPDGVFLL